MNELLKLISTEYEFDEIGNETVKTVDREIFCECMSISQKEYFQCSQSGLKPEYKFKIWLDDYAGETLVTYNDVLYSVYRTYKLNDFIELYVTLKVGDL